MDLPTVSAYDGLAADFAADWHAQPASADLHALVRRFFRPGRTADIGCGTLIGAAILHDQQATSASSGKTIHRVIARKP
jgi:hypothetical protein